MSDFEVISDVSATLRETLIGALAGTPLAGTLVEINNLADTVSPTPPKLTIFLYELAEDPSQRNRRHRRTDVPTGVEIRKPPMALILRYLVTAWAGDMATEQQLLGRALQALYDGAVLSGPQLQGALAGTDETLQVTLVPLTLEEKARVWYSVQQPYRLSLNYEIRVVDLDPLSAEEVATVTARFLDGAAPSTAP